MIRGIIRAIKEKIGGKKMKKYHIGGKEKTEKEAREYCPVCKDGALYKTETFKTNLNGSNTEEKICLNCLTKYIIPLIEPGIKFDTPRGIGVTTDDLDGFDFKQEIKTEEDKVYLALKIGEDLKKMEAEMDKQVLEEKEFFTTTGLCFEHNWITSNPFKTIEGIFTIESCQICRYAKAIYNGKEITGTVFDVLNQIISGGFEFQKALDGNNKLPEEEPIFDIDIETEEPTFDIEFEPQETELNFEGYI